jgi:excisionase family DNA binding protein
MPKGKSAEKLAHNLTTGAEVIGVSRPTLSRMLKEGLIEHKRFGTRVIIPVSAIRKYLGEVQ